MHPQRGLYSYGLWSTSPQKHVITGDRDYRLFMNRRSCLVL